MSDAKQPQPQPQPLHVGIDWSHKEHHVAVRTPAGQTRSFSVEATIDGFQSLLTQLEQMAGGAPIAICMEKARISLFYHLMLRDNIQLYLVDPKQFARYRESFVSSGAKHDRSDAALLLRLLCERAELLRVFQPDDLATRKLAHLVQTRRNMVNERTRLLQQLQDALKIYYPLLLQLAGNKTNAPLLQALLRRWPDPRKLRRARPDLLRRALREAGLKDPDAIQQCISTIRSQPLVTNDAALLETMSIRAKTLLIQIQALQKAINELEQKIDQIMHQHPDAELFRNLRGAGQALAPRLLAAFGSRRDRYDSAEEVTIVTGVAPVTKQSGKARHVVRRRACCKFTLQTFHEFANCARRWCPWSRAYYKLQRANGHGHHAALRKLAYRWIRILYRVWKTKTPYDPQRYLQVLKHRNHPLLQYMD